MENEKQSVENPLCNISAKGWGVILGQVGRHVTEVWHETDFEIEFHHARKEQTKEMKIMVHHKLQDVEGTVAEEAADHAAFCVGAHAHVSDLINSCSVGRHLMNRCVSVCRDDDDDRKRGSNRNESRGCLSRQACCDTVAPLVSVKARVS